MGNEAIRTNKETVTTSETTRKGETYRNPTVRKGPKKITADKSDNTTGRNKSKDIGERRKTPKVSGQDQTIQNKTGHSEITKENSANRLVESAQR